MSLDLENLRTEMQAYLDQQGMPVFYGYSRVLDSLDPVYWDVERHPDFHQFLDTAKVSGAKLVVFFHRAFSLDQIDDALERLEDSDLTRDERKSFENRLRELRAYEGFTCAVELSFDLEGRVYVYEVRTEWYESLNDVLAEIESVTEEEEDDNDGPIGGYFSKN